MISTFLSQNKISFVKYNRGIFSFINPLLHVTLKWLCDICLW